VVGVRLQKVLAHAGVASRRTAEEMIAAGRVTVNGTVVTELGTRVQPGRDAVTVDGVAVAIPATQREAEAAMVVYLLNKPLGVVSTAEDPQGRATVTGMVPPEPRVYPVGRLDADSEGLILLSNNGDLAYRLTHPRYGVDKEYEVLVRGRPPEHALRSLRQGVEVEGEERPLAPAQIERLSEEGSNQWLRVIIHEGRKRQVRRMMETIHHPVLQLRRVRVGPLRLGNLGSGRWRLLRPDEVAALDAASRRQNEPPAEPRPARSTPPAAGRTKEHNEHHERDSHHLRPRRVDHPERGHAGRRGPQPGRGRGRPDRETGAR
jgi:23S rRNA pseudouridine2605 synthase